MDAFEVYRPNGEVELWSDRWQAEQRALDMHWPEFGVRLGHIARDWRPETTHVRSRGRKALAVRRVAVAEDVVVIGYEEGKQLLHGTILARVGKDQTYDNMYIALLRYPTPLP
jgi:hypothetical protein